MNEFFRKMFSFQVYGMIQSKNFKFILKQFTKLTNEIFLYFWLKRKECNEK